jgi:hypothetical protein
VQTLQSDIAVVQAAPAAAPEPGGADASGPTGAAVPAAPTLTLGDLSPFRAITQDTRDPLERRDQPGATNRLTDLKTAWGAGSARAARPGRLDDA